MTLPRLISTVLLVAACTPDPKSLGQGETGDDASDATTPVGSDGEPSPDDGATSMVGTAADSATSAATSVSGDGATTEAGTEDTGDPGSTSRGSSGSGDAESSDTSAAVCEIVESACELADQSKTPPIDCGDITTDDPIDAWQAAHDCALAAATTDDAFKVIVDMQGIDSFPRRAFVGMEGRAYQLMQLDQDFGGIVPGPTPVNYRYCDEVVATPGCTPAVGDICLTCMGNLDGDVLCEP
jgi:hypothetical protein